LVFFFLRFVFLPKFILDDRGMVIRKFSGHRIFATMILIRSMPSHSG
jgi:hypothetical protein